MYGALSALTSCSVGHGRTEETRTIETIDRDRIASRAPASLLGAPVDFYSALGIVPHGRASDRGRTEITESTETIDWDRPPEH